MYFASAHTINPNSEDINQKYATLLLPVYIIFISSLVNYLPYCNNCVHLLYCHFVIDVWNVKESLYSTPHYLTTFYCYYYYYYLTFSVLIISGYQFDRLPKYTFSHLHFFPCFNWCKRMKVSVIYILPKRRYKALFLIYGRMLIAALVCFSGLFLYLFKGGDMGI